MTLRIVHLFPRRLDIDGDIGNAAALATRARWRGFAAEAVAHTGGALPAEVDAVVIGSGPLAAQRAVLPELLDVADALRGLAADGVPMLAVSGGWQLLGEELRTADGETVRGAGVFPSSAELQHGRRVGETAVEGPDGERLTGFANHAGRFRLHDGVQPLGRVRAGPGVGEAEGLLAGSLVGTTLHGPILPMNPVLADAILDTVLEHRRPGIDLEPDPGAREAADELARRSREAILHRLGLLRGR